MKKEELDYLKDYYNGKIDEIRIKKNIYAKLKEELNSILNNPEYNTYLTLINIIEYAKRICMTKDEYDTFVKPYLIMLVNYLNKKDGKYIPLEYKDCRSIIKQIYDIRYNPHEDKESILDDLSRTQTLTSTEDIYVLCGSNFSSESLSLILTNIEDTRTEGLPLKCFKEFNRRNTVLYSDYFTEDSSDSYFNLRKVYLKTAILEGQSMAVVEMKSIKNRQLAKKLDKNRLLK